MKREVSLEDYFKMKPLDRDEYVDDITSLLSAWEPSIRSHIEDILRFARLTVCDGPEDAAIELLSKIKSHQIIHSLRRHITAKESGRSTNVCILISAIALNLMIDFDTRFNTLEYYVSNPRYKMDEEIKQALSEAFKILEEELKEKVETMRVVKELLL